MKKLPTTAVSHEQDLCTTSKVGAAETDVDQPSGVLPKLHGSQAAQQNGRSDEREKLGADQRLLQAARILATGAIRAALHSSAVTRDSDRPECDQQEPPAVDGMAGVTA